MINQLINVFWTIVSFAVAGFYWGLHFAEQRPAMILWWILVLSILGYMTPRKWLLALTLSDNRKTYERIGVTFILWFVQNGTWVNRLQRKSGKHKALIHNRKSARSYLGTIDMQERYHYSCFVFFTLSACVALLTGKTAMAFLITLSNIIYNVYPILLQQYNRLRIGLILSGESRGDEVPEN
jgi:hypothetical protein